MIQQLVLKPSLVSAFLIGVLNAGRVPYLHGSPAIGKSDLVQAVADHFDLKLVDFRLSQCDPTDLNGFPFMENGRSTYAPNKSFPIVGDDLPKKADGTSYKGWLLFFDELTSAPRAVQAAAYKILLDKQVGDHDLHPAVMMAGAGNRSTDGAIAEEMGTALQSRLIHAVMAPNLDDWTSWAYTAGIDASVISFLQWKPAMLYQFNPEHTDLTFPAPRTWHMASDLLKTFPPGNDPFMTKAALSGALGQGAAAEFMSFQDLLGKVPTITEIIANPGGTRVPPENGHCFALAGSIAAHFSPANAAPLMVYLGRMSIEYQTVALRSAIKRDLSLMKVPEILTWARSNAHLLQ